MKDSDPRPMPVEVQWAYREPIDLLALLGTSVYSDEDRMYVRDTLLRSLLEKHGDVWVESGSKEVRVSTRVKSFRKNTTKALSLLLDVPDYGGRDETLPMLASVMQPRWAQWWEWFFLHQWNIRPWWDVAESVLGERQSVWLAAQYARTVIDVVRPQDRDVCLRAIEAAELWARVPSEASRTKARSAALATYEAGLRATTVGARSAAYAAHYAALAAANAATTAAADYAAEAAANAADANAADAERFTFGADTDGYDRLADLTRSLITPTLVTSAARSSGASSVRSVALPVAMGALVGVGAVHLAKRA